MDERADEKTQMLEGWRQKYPNMYFVECYNKEEFKSGKKKGTL
jgi:hypothetical protein